MDVLRLFEECNIGSRTEDSPAVDEEELGILLSEGNAVVLSTLQESEASCRKS